MNNDLFTLLTRLIKEIKMAVKKADVVMNIKHLLEDLKDEMVAYSSLPSLTLNNFKTLFWMHVKPFRIVIIRRMVLVLNLAYVLLHSIVRMRKQLRVLTAILLSVMVNNTNYSTIC